LGGVWGVGGSITGGRGGAEGKKWEAVVTEENFVLQGLRSKKGECGEMGKGGRKSGCGR